MADNATHSFGTSISKGTFDRADPETVPGSFTEFGQLIDAQLIKSKATQVKATRLNQSDRYMRYRKGFVDPGEYAFKIHFSKADYTTLLEMDASGDEYWWKVEVPEPDDETDVSLLHFHGYVAGVSGEIPEDGGMTVDVTIQVSGAPQWTEAA